MDPIVAVYSIKVTLRSADPDVEALKLAEVEDAVEDALTVFDGIEANAEAERVD